jgi:hypothetical protein
MIARVSGSRRVKAEPAPCWVARSIDDREARGRSLLNIRGELVPYLRLRELFGCDVPSEPHQMHRRERDDVVPVADPDQQALDDREGQRQPQGEGRAGALLG